MTILRHIIFGIDIVLCCVLIFPQRKYTLPLHSHRPVQITANCCSCFWSVSKCRIFLGISWGFPGFPGFSLISTEQFIWILLYLSFISFPTMVPSVDSLGGPLRLSLHRPAIIASCPKTSLSPSMRMKRTGFNHLPSTHGSRSSRLNDPSQKWTELCSRSNQRCLRVFLLAPLLVIKSDYPLQNTSCGASMPWKIGRPVIQQQKTTKIRRKRWESWPLKTTATWLLIDISLANDGSFWSWSSFIKDTNERSWSPTGAYGYWLVMVNYPVQVADFPVHSDS